jgi:surface polysaccharide O-acyltransferase-like enzyme
MADKTARNPAMDIIRSCALLFVIAVHFFLNNGFCFFYNFFLWFFRSTTASHQGNL